MEEDHDRLIDLAAHMLALALRAQKAGRIGIANDFPRVAADACEHAFGESEKAKTRTRKFAVPGAERPII